MIKNATSRYLAFFYYLPLFLPQKEFFMSKDYDPHMHTVEHILNQTMVRTFGCGRCFSSHLNPKKSKCDYYFDRSLENAEAEALEAAVNAVISQNLDVSELQIPRREAEKQVNLSKLPASVGAEEPIRIVTVGDYDICPCIGAHVANTRELGVFRLVSHDFSIKEQETQGILRLRFRLDPI